MKNLVNTTIVAVHFGVTSERVRQLIKEEMIYPMPQYQCGNELFWHSLPRRRVKPIAKDKLRPGICWKHNQEHTGWEFCPCACHGRPTSEEVQ